MSTITLPTDVAVIRFSMRNMPNQRVFASPFQGSEQVVDLLNDRWRISMTAQPLLEADGGSLEGFLTALRGQINTCDLYHFSRPAPKGTLRGSPTINGAHAQGASTLSINTTTGYTLKRGDLIGVASRIHMVATDCTASGGVISVPLATRLRAALAGGEAVTWDKPKAAFRLVSDSAPIYEGGLTGPVDLEFVEAIS